MKTRKVVLGIGLTLVVLFVVALFVGAMAWGRAPYGMGPGMMGAWRSPGGMHSFGGAIALVVLGVLLLGGLVLLVMRLAHNGEAPPRTQETPLDILARRYASGEIDREEFERIKESLLT